MPSLQDIISRRTYQWKQKGFDTHLQYTGNEMKTLIITEEDLNMYEDTSLTLTGTKTVTGYVDFPNDEIPITFSKESAIKDHFHLYDVLPIQGYFKFTDDIKVGDILAMKVVMNDSNTQLVTLQVTERVVRARKYVTYQKFNMAPYTSDLDNYPNIEYELDTFLSEDSDITGFITEWSVTSGDTITLPLLDTYDYDFIVDWGDGLSESYTTSNVSHTYSTSGDFQVEIRGACPAWSFQNSTNSDVLLTTNRDKITSIVNWGDSYLFNGFDYLAGGFYDCSNLVIEADGSILLNESATNLSHLFDSTSVTSLSEGLFDNATNVTDFSYAFYSCVSLTSIGTFLFANCSSALDFSYTFDMCSTLTSLDEEMFIDCTNATDFSYCFANTIVDEIPAKLFYTNINALDFSHVFENTPVEQVPSGLFYMNTLVITFSYAFNNCTSLTTLADFMFRTNINCLDFSYTFNGCTSLTINETMFYEPDEEDTRFLDQDVNFDYMFYRESWGSVQGVAPELWNCDFGVGSFSSINCFGGNGNSLTSIENYNDIPELWGNRTFLQLEIEIEEGTLSTALPLLSGYDYAFTVDWGDDTINNITSYDSAIHIYGEAGTYTIEIKGNCPAINYFNSPLKSTYPQLVTQLTSIQNWGSYYGISGFEEISFYGCTNLSFISEGGMQASENLLSLNACFADCTSITSVPSDVFVNCTNVDDTSTLFYNTSSLLTVPSNIFNSLTKSTTFFNTFKGSGLTTVPEGLFENNQLVTTFNNCFQNCDNLVSIGDGLFDNNVETTSFVSTFSNCTSLAYVPSKLFKNNTKVTSFRFTFQNCNKLQLVSDLFYDDGEQETRFTEVSLVDFIRCFDRNSFTGDQGEAPDLWNCNFNSVSSTNCFIGLGNNTTSISNYEEIYYEWGGPSTPLQLEVTISSSNLTTALPLLDEYDYDFTVDWGDGVIEEVTSYSEAVHTYTSENDYTISIEGSLPALNYIDSPLKSTYPQLVTQLSNIISWGTSSRFDGFEDVSFYGCTNLLSVADGGIKALPSLTSLYGCFGSCSSLISIPGDIFQNCVNVTNMEFTFSQCFALTSIGSGIFDNNLLVTTFRRCFSFAQSLSSIPDNLMRNNINAINFNSTFDSCASLALSSDIFYSEGEQSTRFLNKTVNFQDCFYRSYYLGTQGEAPDLWNCDFGTGTPTTISCFGGSGNSTTSLSNYNDIPSEWIS